MVGLLKLVICSTLKTPC